MLAQKIEQLNSAIDEVSTQLRTEDSPNGVAVNSDEVEPAIWNYRYFPLHCPWLGDSQ